MKKTFYTNLIKDLRKADSEQKKCFELIEKLLVKLDCYTKTTGKTARDAAKDIQSYLDQLLCRLKSESIKESLKELKKSVQSNKDLSRPNARISKRRYEDYSYSSIGLDDFCSEYDC